MPKKARRTLMVVLVVFILVSLTYRFYVEEQFQSEFNRTEMNTQLKFLKPDPGWNSFKTEDGVHLEFINASTQNIMWDIRTDVEIVYFNIKKLQWQRIANQIKYIPIDGEETNVIEPMNSGAPPVNIWIKPSLGAWFGLQVFRVVVVGQQLIDGVPSGKFTGAYIDVTLHK